MLRHYVNPRQTGWETLLPVDEFAINNSFQMSIQDTPVVPFCLDYGRHPRVLPDIRLPEVNLLLTSTLTRLICQAMQRARQCLQAAQQRQTRYADKHRSDLSFKVNDEVLLSTEHIPLRAVGTRKLLMKWMGPCTVVRVVNQVAYQVKLPDGRRIHDVFSCQSAEAISQEWHAPAASTSLVG